jgi:predicted GNAT family acetyltransferase
MTEREHEVLHQPQRQRFVIAADGAEALLEYRMLAPEVIDFVHTYTPAQLRGQGLAGKLVEFAVTYARNQGWRVIGSCSYVAAWLEKHPAGR